MLFEILFKTEKWASNFLTPNAILKLTSSIMACEEGNHGTFPLKIRTIVGKISATKFLINIM